MSSSATDRTSEYPAAVLAGEIVAGPHVRNACRRHFDDLEKGAARGLWFDPDAADRVIRFFEERLFLNGGQFEGRPFKLHPSQAFRLGSLFGWKRADGSRRFRRFYDEEGKGNGKSPLAAGIGLYMMTADGEARAEIYAAAAKKDQAQVLFRDAVAMRDQSPSLRARVKTSGGPGKEFNLGHLKSGSFFRPISKEAGTTGSGPRPHCALCDEVHEHPNRTIIEMLERGFKFRQQPLLGMFTNSGHDLATICGEEHKHGVRVCAGTLAPDKDFTYVGEPIDDTTFAFICSLDPGDNPLEDSSCWIKTNPLLGVILSPDYLAGVVDQARLSPAKANNILRLHFCVWTESETAWMTRKALEAVLADFDPAQSVGRISGAVDLSGTRDLTAAAFVVETGSVDQDVEVDGEVQRMTLPTYDAWVEAWTSEGYLEQLRTESIDAWANLRAWHDAGALRVTSGKIVRFETVAPFVAGVFAERPDVNALAFDRYAFHRFDEELDGAGFAVERWEHPQGGKRRSRPPKRILEECRKADTEPPLGLWMPSSLEALEQAILQERIRIRSSPVVIGAIMSAVIKEDDFGNRWFVKGDRKRHIDPAVALAMAVGMAMANSIPNAPSVYERRGILVV